MKKCCSSLRGFSPAFSLVEMLMALLVASLLLAALAPVMTRRMADHEIKVMSEAANYDKDMVVSVFTEDTDFNIPADANQVRVTMMGGGGRGGDALYGNKEFTSTQNFTVPQNVSKLRVFMIGGGGGGASGGLGTGTIQENIAGTTDKTETLTTSQNIDIDEKVLRRIPTLNELCIASGVAKWSLTSNNSLKYSPNDPVFTAIVCGGGGGGGGGGGSRSGGTGGGSGGGGGECVEKFLIGIKSAYIQIGAGGGYGSGGSHTSGGAGGGGGSGYVNGKNGTAGSLVEANSCGGGGGGGGGGSSALLTSDKSTVIILAGGGGGGGGGDATVSCSHVSAGGAGGAGGAGTTGGGEGGGASGTNCVGSCCHLTRHKNGFDGAGGPYNGILGAAGGGGAGGGGGYTTGKDIIGSNGNKQQGGNGAGGSLNTAGVRGGNGGNGYAVIHYGGSTLINYLECDYSIAANGGGGGAAGQISVGEISVTPGEVLTFEIGAGGLAQSVSGKNGNNGKATYIKRGASAVMSANGGYGGEYSSSETTPSQGGSFRNPVIGVNWTGIDYRNNNTYAAGSNGNLASDGSNTSYGGAGGYSQDIKGNLIAGGIGGNTSKDGLSPLTNNYGAGGGGGSGSQTVGDSTFGKGGAGASGYIYVEWGGSNGGGGTAGELIQKTYTNIDNSNRVMKIRIGRGGGITTGSEDSPVIDSTTIGLNGNGGITSTKAYSGGKEITYSANGGIKGKDGDVNKGNHGGETGIPSGFSDKYKEYIQGNMNIILGQKADDEYGGMGGYLSCLYKSKDEEGNEIYAATVKANDGSDNSTGPIRPGCGGTSIASPLYDAVCRAYSSNDSPNGGNGSFGGGGGGGAVLDNVGGKGGNGGNGFVILEYKSTTLD